MPGSSKPSRDFEVVLHVGYPKTASTWLQETVFSNPESGFAYPWGVSNCRARTTAAFLTVNSYCDDVKWARSFFEEGLQECAGRPRVPIISDEILCGDPTVRINNYTGRYMADRIHAAFPSAKILIGVREQKSIALSFYREYLLGCGVFPLEVFIGRGDEPLGYTPILYPEYLEYDRAVSYYQKLYGKDNVLVLPMERLSRDPAAYVRSILDFCQCAGKIEEFSEAKHVGQTAAALAVRRVFNPLIPLNPLTPQRSLGWRAVDKLSRIIDRIAFKSWNKRIENRWKDIIKRRYEGRFVESNRRLAELTGIDFAALGYERYGRISDKRTRPVSSPGDHCGEPPHHHQRG